MKAVISGYDGFIGSHLASAITLMGIQVIPIHRNLLYSAPDLKGFFMKENPDYIFHLAAYGNMASQKDIPTIFAANLVSGFNMLNESADIRYRAFINFGTSSEYGRKSKAMSEEDFLAPETFYAATKAGLTHLAGVFAKQLCKPIFTVRPFSVYGPAEADFRFIPTVIRSILTGIPFPLDENANHDWVYIDDFIEAILLVIKNVNHLCGKYSVINIGSGHMYSNKEVCETLKKIVGKDYSATPVTGLRTGASQVWQSGNEIISTLGFQPKFTLTQGLARTFNYYREKYEIKP